MYISSTQLIHLTNKILYPLANISSSPQTLVTTILFPASLSFTFLDFIYKWDNTAFVFQFLASII